MNLTCIMCPMGCSLKVTKKKNGEYSVSGNNCIRGEKYGISEVTMPTRVVTTVAKSNVGFVSVKTTNPIDKKMVTKVVKEIGKLYLTNPRHGEVILPNVLGLNADVIVTSGN